MAADPSSREVGRAAVGEGPRPPASLRFRSPFRRACGALLFLLCATALAATCTGGVLLAVLLDHAISGPPRFWDPDGWRAVAWDGGRVACWQATDPNGSGRGDGLALHERDATTGAVRTMQLPAPGIPGRPYSDLAWDSDGDTLYLLQGPGTDRRTRDDPVVLTVVRRASGDTARFPLAVRGVSGSALVTAAGTGRVYLRYYLRGEPESVEGVPRIKCSYLAPLTVTGPGRPLAMGGKVPSLGLWEDQGVLTTYQPYEGIREYDRRKGDLVATHAVHPHEPERAPELPGPDMRWRADWNDVGRFVSRTELVVGTQGGHLVRWNWSTGATRWTRLRVTTADFMSVSPDGAAVSYWGAPEYWAARERGEHPAPETEMLSWAP